LPRGHVVWILRISAHPARKCLVVGKQAGVAATLSEPRSLRHGVDIEKADGDRVELVGRGCGDHLAGSDRIAGEQQVPTARLKVERAAACQAAGGAGPSGRRRDKQVDGLTFRAARKLPQPGANVVAAVVRRSA
jgi:hypothetical protein